MDVGEENFKTQQHDWSIFTWPVQLFLAFDYIEVVLDHMVVYILYAKAQGAFVLMFFPSLYI